MLRCFELVTLAFAILYSLTGCDCALVLEPTGPTLINKLVGDNVTLGVSFSGVKSPLVTWNKGSLTVAVWVIGSGILPDIDPEHTGILELDPSGSLMFSKLPLSCNGSYVVQMTKLGFQAASVNFTLLVYDMIKDVSVDTGDPYPFEGGPPFNLSYSTVQGEARTAKWFFNGLELVNGSRYSITERKLTIRSPSRNDTGLYTVNATNPFSSATHSRNITVLYGPDQPVLEVSPTKGTFVSGETLSLSCRAEGEPIPIASWFYNGQDLHTTPNGTHKLSNVQPSDSGVYTCRMVNGKTGLRLERNITISIKGLSASAIAGIAAGIPCGILLLLFIIALIILCVNCYKKKDQNPRYPVSRAVEKAIISQSDLTKPHKLLSNGLKIPPDYRQRHQAPAERAGPLPFEMPPVRLATTV